MPRKIVILGAGFAGAYCAQALERRLGRDEAEVLLIDRHNYFSFSPLLVEAGIGTIEPRHAVIAIRAFLKRTQFRMAEVLDVDFARREVVYHVDETDTLACAPFDHLVLAFGSVSNLPPVPGLAEHAYEMKGLADAVALRDRAITMLEAAEATADPERRRAMLHFVVVGGNYTGIEVAGEFDVFLKDAARRYGMLAPEDCQVTLVEMADRILPALDRDLAAYATRQLRGRGVDVRLERTVREISRDRVTLSDGEVLSARTVIWTAGIAANPLYRRLHLPMDERGYVLCEPDLRVLGFDNVWGIGDCAVNPDPDDRPYPATAQHAVQEGRHLADNLARVLRGRHTRPFVYRSKGTLAALGCRTGVARVFGFKLSGFAAWFLWRTVYLMKMPGWRRRARVAADWTLSLFSRSEVVQLGVHRAAVRSEPEGAADRRAS
ncbi:MAG: NAD(P)/FAD-dependent oxidoreductase [Acidobacteria bacterium]|nr:NAD(P)/FAD-dependent oxidoreductase [Acidobacteriota bacterium]